ncbi:MAG: hypothetical protein EOM18_15830 [Clostridia bacterium]|nr:hypothetical protein [Clostridia bacterium]
MQKVIYISLISLLLVGCVGYQDVVEYEYQDGKKVPVYAVRGRIWGTSGQSITTPRVVIEKRDAVDKAVELAEKGIAAGISVAKGSDIL